MAELNKVKVALLGSGTVGTGVYKLINRQRKEMPYKVGADLVVEKVLVRDKNKKREGIDSSLLTDQWEDIILDDDIQIVVEVMGGIEPAHTYIKEALQAGKNVVTANKDLIAEYGKELLDTAEENGCDLLFEASVAGGIPILRPLKHCLAGNYLTEVMGIVNGTTNFILTKMAEEGMEFKEALALATELGYAEADPTADIEGYDAGRKMAIMASIAFNSRVTFDDVYTEGITNISSKDIQYAKEMGCAIKLLGVARNTETGIEVRVHPMLIPLDHPLAGVNDAFNAVFVHGDAVDDAMFYGRGAGEMPTASAVMGDIIDVARNIQFHCCGRIHCTCYKNLPIKKITEIESKYFMRMLVEDKPGVLAKIADTLGRNNVSIAQVVQKNKINDLAELVVITDSVLEQNFADALTSIKGMDITKEISTVIRVY
ncbi:MULTISPECIES: homoserine dehydrogenase [Anaerostipes]|uniref:Homoserine dehydrogenase n=1 Tax=Anaerostipes butyraticus TaxID=645466 RepID=A0A916VDR3_9FIRM|nr:MULTISPECIES: homoserine dehydrogenase [Anaerostipes]GFO86589.1 homoserine dehydrogenase [Anaerostipes butyraticus]HJC81897.1 homoserine dehydrogenase [Candidatus Anaerostipes avicola]